MLILCLYPDLSKASSDGLTESLNISFEEDNDEGLDSIEIESSLIIDNEWPDSVFMHFISLFSFW